MKMMEEMLYLSRHLPESPFHLIGHLYLFYRLFHAFCCDSSREAIRKYPGLLYQGEQT